jgi:hypothetical protein
MIPGQAQKELGIEKEASYVISVINPKIPSADIPALKKHQNIQNKY